MACQSKPSQVKILTTPITSQMGVILLGISSDTFTLLPYIYKISTDTVLKLILPASKCHSHFLDDKRIEEWTKIFNLRVEIGVTHMLDSDQQFIHDLL